LQTVRSAMHGKHHNGCHDERQGGR
jgi:hypothetical protein